MKSADIVMHPRFEEQLPVVATLNSLELEALEDAIQVRRMEIMAAQLESAGFAVRTRAGNGDQFCYLCIYPSANEIPGEWATLAEAQRLLDFAANLPTGEAFARWRKVVEPLADAPYTKADALADMKRERAEIKRLYEEGKISKDELLEGYANSRDLPTLAQE